MPVRSPFSSVMPALSIATSVPVPMAMPTSAAASAGASLTPSPAMATTRPSRRSFSTTALLLSGSTSASTSSMPSWRATACAVVRLSPVSMTTRRLLGAQAPRAHRRVVCFTGSAMANDAGEPCRRRRRRSRSRRRARRRSACGGERRRRRCRARPGNSALPSATRLPSTMPMAPLPVGESKSRDRRQRELPSRSRARTIAARERMLAGALDACGQPQHFVLVEARRGDDRRHRRLAFGQRAGLVDDQRVDLLHALQRLGILDQHADFGAAADADHDRHRRGEPERAGAGDDQHADGGDQAIGEARLRPEHRPGGEGDERNRDHSRHEPARDLVGEALDRRARALRLRDHLHDLREQRVAADLVGAHDEAAAAC